MWMEPSLSPHLQSCLLDVGPSCPHRLSEMTLALFAYMLVSVGAGLCEMVRVGVEGREAKWHPEPQDAV